MKWEPKVDLVKNFKFQHIRTQKRPLLAFIWTSQVQVQQNWNNQGGWFWVWKSGQWDSFLGSQAGHSAEGPRSVLLLELKLHVSHSLAVLVRKMRATENGIRSDLLPLRVSIFTAEDATRSKWRQPEERQQNYWFLGSISSHHIRI